jgi:phage terminase large subunit-like protein
MVLNFSEPMKMLDALILSGNLSHEHNPAMRWMISNVVNKPDQKDGHYPNKERPDSKIDGPVALIMAKRLWTLVGDQQPAEHRILFV